MKRRAILAASGLTQTFGERTVLRGVDVELAGGEVLAVMGASGSGKSTLLYALAGLRQPDRGIVSWGSVSDVWKLQEPHITRTRRTMCGFVFQFAAFVGDLTVTDNVAVPLVIAGRKPSDARHRARLLLNRFGLDHVADRYPATLSGGELQRASIARALTMDPRVVFADEPTGALDEENSELVVETLKGAARSSGVAVLVVTHDPTVAAATDRVLRLKGGRLIETQAV